MANGPETLKLCRDLADEDLPPVGTHLCLCAWQAKAAHDGGVKKGSPYALACRAMTASTPGWQARRAEASRPGRPR